MTGERGDLTYSVTCENCDEKVRFEPSSADLTEASVVVADLESHVNYTFTVESHSGVSQFGVERAAASITTSLDYTGELVHMSSSAICMSAAHPAFSCRKD